MCQQSFHCLSDLPFVQLFSVAWVAEVEAEAGIEAEVEAEVAVEVATGVEAEYSISLCLISCRLVCGIPQLTLHAHA